jgi:hypothetical protein
VIRRTHRHTLAALGFALALITGLAGGVALAAPHGGTGGGGLAGTGTTSTDPTESGSGSATVASTPTVSASGDGITLRTTATGVAGQVLHVSGTVPSGDGGNTVALEQLGAQDGDWTAVAHAKSSHSNHFKLSFQPTTVGHLAFAAIVESAAAAGLSAGPAAGVPVLDVDIVHSYVATFYGPGLWGNAVACRHKGHLVKLKPSTLGVASHTNVACGTKVTFYYRGKEITVPVIDREGNNSIGTWDLTEKTAEDLGITETVTVGASWR